MILLLTAVVVHRGHTSAYKRLFFCGFLFVFVFLHKFKKQESDYLFY